MYATLFHDFHFSLSSIFCTADDRTCVAHSPPLRRCLASNKANNRLSAVRFDVLSSFCFHATANFTDHDDAVRVRVVHQELNGFLGRSADDGVTTDANTSRLAHARLGHLVHCFISQCARAGNDADTARVVDKARHDAALGAARCDDTRAVGPNEAAVTAIEVGFHLNHILHRDPFGNTNDDFNASICSLHDRVTGESRGHENDRSVCTCFFYSICYGIENRLAQVLLATFARRYTAYDIRAVLDHLLSVKGAFLSGKALNDDLRILIYKN